MIFEGSVPARLTISSRVALLILAFAFLPLILGRAAIADSENKASLVATRVEKETDASATDSTQQNTNHKTSASNTDVPGKKTKQLLKRTSLQSTPATRAGKQPKRVLNLRTVRPPS